jgi:N-acyl-D-amino-acid deacylase
VRTVWINASIKKSCVGLLLLALLAPIAQADWIIRGAEIVDGTGARPRSGDVAIRDGRIAAIGKVEASKSDRVFEAKGLVLAPGFIDAHSHHDRGLAEHPDAIAAVSQGVTTIVVGMDGDSTLPLAGWFSELERTPAAVNVASFSGFGTLRRAAMGSDYRRVARQDEIRHMSELLAADMQAGALGLATGIEYDPDIYSSTDELVQLSRVASQHGGVYASHMRSEDVALDAALAELATIAREAQIPAHISHFKLALLDRWGEAPKLLERLDGWRKEGLDITADAYPYDSWHSNLTVLFPKRDFTNLEQARYVLAHTTPPDGLILTEFTAEPSYVGKNLLQIAELRRTSPEQALVDLIRMAYPDGNTDDPKYSESIMGRSMREDDIAAILAWPQTTICSDGSLDGGHPRGYGAFPKYLHAYGLKGTPESLASSVHKMTGLTASQYHLGDRGRIAPGLPADLVLFDPATVRDRSTIVRPHEVAAGIHGVWVNGELVWDGEKPTGARPGQVVRRATQR